jgi:hypothetical protein
MPDLPGVRPEARVRRIPSVREGTVVRDRGRGIGRRDEELFKL